MNRTPSSVSRPAPAFSDSALNLPQLDPVLSPHTGFTRAHWEAVADHLLLALRPHSSVGHALLTPPGRPSRSGGLSDGFEGFSRSFLLAAGLIRARGDDDPFAHGAWYAAGLAAGVDPEAQDAWPRPSGCDQAKVEACALALALDATRAQVWDRLEPEARSRLVDAEGGSRELTVRGEQKAPSTCKP